MSGRIWTEAETDLVASAIATLANYNRDFTNLDVYNLIKDKITRTEAAVCTEAVRFAKATRGLVFHSDVLNQNYEECYLRRRKAAKKVHIELQGSNKPKSLRPSERKGTTHRSDPPNTSVRYANVTSLARDISLEKTKEKRWQRIRDKVRVCCNKMLAEQYGSNPRTIQRYKNGGLGYEQGPPLKFVAFCEQLV